MKIKETTILDKVLELGIKLPMFLTVEQIGMIHGSDSNNLYFAVFPHFSGFYQALNGFSRFEKYRHTTGNGRAVTLYYFKLSRNEFYQIFNKLKLKESSKFVKENEKMTEYRQKNLTKV